MKLAPDVHALATNNGGIPRPIIINDTLHAPNTVLVNSTISSYFLNLLYFALCSDISRSNIFFVRMISLIVFCLLSINILVRLIIFLGKKINITIIYISDIMENTKDIEIEGKVQIIKDGMAIYGKWYKDNKLFSDTLVDDFDECLQIVKNFPAIKSHHKYIICSKKYKEHIEREAKKKIAQKLKMKK